MPRLLRPYKTIRAYLAAFLLCLSTLFLPPFVRAESYQYDIKATYDEDHHHIEGVEKIRFTNTGKTDMSEIFLFLYPNIYREKNPRWNKDTLRRAYPTQFNAGSIEILSIQDQRGIDIPLPDSFGTGTIDHILLDTPIPPSASSEITIQFITRIPERFGLFGQFRDVVTLQGGWHPYLPDLVNGQWDLNRPPPASQFHVALTFPKVFHLIASTEMQLIQRQAEGIAVSGLAASLPFFSLSLSKGSDVAKKKIGELTLVYTGPPSNQEYGDQVLDSAVEAASFFLLNFGALPKMEMNLTYATLFQDLATTGARLLYVDSKLFKVFTKLKRFHDVRIAKGVMLILLQELIPSEEPWALEAIAESLAKQYSLHQYPSQFDLKERLRPIRFFPWIDQILYSDQVSFRQIYFNELEINNESVFSFNHGTGDQIAGSTLLKRGLGTEKLNFALMVYKEQMDKGGHPKFADILHDLYPEIGYLIEARHRASSPIDFEIAQIKRKKVERAYHTTIHLKKEGRKVEPVEIVLYEQSGTRIPLRWDGQGNQYETNVMTFSPISTVAIDPEQKTSDMKLSNNLEPKPWKVILNRYGVEYDLTTDFLSYDAGLLFQPVYDADEKVGVDFIHVNTLDLGRVYYFRRLLNRHLLTTGLTYRSPQSSIGIAPEEPAGTAHFSYSLSYPDIPFLPSSMEWLTGQRPHLSLTLGYDKRFTGGIYDSLESVRLEFRRSFSFSNYHELSTRFLTGFSSGELFKENRFFLGGNEGIRGYTPLRFEGDHISLFSLEYRFPLLYETDINLLGLALIHTLQGAVFADFGGVANQVKHLQPSEFMSDMGAGVRWFADSFGIMPVIFRFDVAWPIHSPVAEENVPHFYLSAGQPF